MFLRSSRAALVLFATLLTVFTAISLAPRETVADADAVPSPARFTADGKLLRPEGYRLWVYVGTPLTPNDMNNGKAAFPEFHNVYIDRGSFRHWQQTGTWRDGTILVKELISVGSKQAVSGNGYFMGKFRGLEATVKSKRWFPKEPGNWAYFSFGHDYPLAKVAKAFATSDCSSCHENSANDDFVFTQYYPVLSAAKPGSDGTILSKEKKETAAKPSAPAAGAVSSVPVESQALFQWLKAGKYKAFAKEDGVHPGGGPHTRRGLPVRVFYDPILAKSLKADATVHPAGSAAVKEMWDGKNNLAGWAVMVKTQADSDGGKGWYWYEVTSTTDGSKPVAAANGPRLCTGCHTPGRDYVLSSRAFR